MVVVGIVGPCAAGKTTLISSLRLMGIRAKHIAQEHSYVPDMWRRLSKPDILIYLDVKYPITVIRRKLNWTLSEYGQQVDRLTHAKENANLVINTDNHTPEEILGEVIRYLKQVGAYYDP